MKAYSRLRRVTLMMALTVLALMVTASLPVRAAGPWYVAPGGNDGNSCLSPASPCATINGAIGKASSGDTIFVAIGTYTGTGDEVVLADKDVTLSGGWDSTFTVQSGRSIIDGEESRRGISVNPDVTATIECFVVQNGYSAGGGGIRNSGGTVILINSTVSRNAAAIEGGGIHFGQPYSDSSLTLYNSTVSGNSADENGGGIFIYGGQYGSAAFLHNSTISGNTAGDGGGIYIYGDRGTLTLNNSTISDNMASGNGGGIYNRYGEVNLQNTILAGNAALSGPDCSWSAIDSLGYNLIGDTSDCTLSPGTGDLTDVDADLGLLLEPPSAPWYHPLLQGSPAIDAGNPAGCTDHLGNPLDTDQRGAARVGRCDMGAYEYTIPGPAAGIFAFGGTPQYALPFRAFDTPVQAAVLDNIGSPVNNATVTFSAPESGASGTFADSGTSTTTALTDDSGIATAATFTANGLRGSYTVTATVGGVVTPANFLLNNTAWHVAPGGSDSNSCLLPITACATINGALSKPGFAVGDPILIATGMYTGTGAEVVLLDKGATLSGGWDASFTTQSGTCTIDGGNMRRGIAVNSDVTALIDRFTVQNGYTGGDGGGIENAGTLTLNNSTVGGNTAGGNGGGIYSGGTLTLNSSAVTGNTTSQQGAGIVNDEDALVILNNCTVSGNAATDQDSTGGGIFNRGALAVSNCTVSDNTARDGGGGGIFTWSSGTTGLQNTIVAGNTTSGTGPDCSGTIVSGGYNLIGDTSGCVYGPGPGDLLDVDPSLFLPVGLPGYYPLRPGSPAIDAGNPAGCTDLLGNSLDTDQRGTPRPLDGDGDGNAVCDMGAYEVDPEHPHVEFLLPFVTLDYYQCPDFFDDFSDPASGWDVVDDEFVHSQYAKGEFRILTKQAGYFYLFRAPTCDRQNYVVEADARWVGTPGSSYGLIFGITSGYEQFYLYDMNTDYRQFRLFRVDPGGLTVLVPPTYAAAIQGGTASNHLKVIRNGGQITLAVNGTVLGTWSDGTIGGRTGAGLVTNPYHDIPTSDARFDNFSIIGLPSSGAAAQEPGGLMAEERELAAPNARRIPVPVDMGW